MRTRDQRRHHLERLKKKARWVATQHDLPWDSPEKREARRRAWEKLADHLAVCSCWMCGTPRRVHGPRPQEARALRYWQQDLEEWEAHRGLTWRDSEHERDWWRGKELT